MRFKFIFLTMLLCSGSFYSQNSKNTFNFWIGNWDAYWKGDTLRGANTISKTLNSNVIEESFLFNDGSFTGRSWSVYDSIAKTWRQTWVDDAGAYLTFTGGQEKEKVVLTLTDKKGKNGKQISMRMVFYNIKPDSFDWDWQSSEDGTAWKSNWLIHYRRKS